ncbi:hypothetical protein WH7805_06241 [Synechococcus sp. WH 7805]|nr:hypothetical protein WH7805_06241 [Synechococcus sp. WH 7805]
MVPSDMRAKRKRQASQPDGQWSTQDPVPALSARTAPQSLPSPAQ